MLAYYPGCGAGENDPRPERRAGAHDEGNPGRHAPLVYLAGRVLLVSHAGWGRRYMHDVPFVKGPAGRACGGTGQAVAFARLESGGASRWG